MVGGELVGAAASQVDPHSFTSSHTSPLFHIQAHISTLSHPATHPYSLTSSHPSPLFHAPACLPRPVCTPDAAPPCPTQIIAGEDWLELPGKPGARADIWTADPW